jgi:hypothetical protein
MKSGNLNFLEPSGPLQACNGTALPLPLYNPWKFVKTVQLHPIQYSSFAEFVCNFGCVDGHTATWCIRQSTSRSISTIYTTATDLSKSNILTLFLNCFLVRTPTLLGKSRRKWGDNMQRIKQVMCSYMNFGKLALEGNLGRSHALIYIYIKNI